MSNKLEDIKSIVGEERLARALEVLTALGAKIPEDFEINWHSFPNISNKKSGTIDLLNSQRDRKDNFLGFNDYSINIEFNKNSHRYNWRYHTDSQEIKHETLDINNGDLNVIFDQIPKATTTSSLFIYNDYWSSPRFKSDISDVSIFDKEETKIPIDNYFDMFASFIKKEKGDYYLPRIMENSEVVDTILKIFESPIKSFVNDLKNNDVDCRFVKENEAITTDYNDKVKALFMSYKKTVKDAREKLDNNLQYLENNRNQELAELEELHHDYEGKKLKR